MLEILLHRVMDSNTGNTSYCKLKDIPNIGKISFRHNASEFHRIIDDVLTLICI